ncbi:A-kinase anchor protein 200 [Spodoptera frugiperda]|uniref:A-kinase anchor protein 200 n=3 Tax=Spodoptera frugiperda TaxID=7108 RepID=A0A9R0CZ00_SPOFR|nr:A-kinase anchor protein 200 [Spodoptera frugiperda]XP_035434054.1 A-kinase anchor protein 200 [Spodoptera frugiperda]
MGAKQSKRSVDISGKEAEGAGEVAAAGAGGEGRVEQLADADALKPQLNGDAHIHEQTENQKDVDSGTPENEKDATTEKEAKVNEEEKEAAPLTNGESEPKVENGDSTPTPEDGKKPKKEKVKKKWSLRSISFSRKDKPKQEKKQKEEEPKTNGETEKVPEEAAEAVSEPTVTETAEEAKSESETKEEKTPETPVTEPITNGSSTPETPKVESPVVEEPAAASPAVDSPEPQPETQPEQLPVNGLSLEEPVKEIEKVEQNEESKEAPVADTTEIVPEIPVKKEVCVEQMPLIDSTPPPLPANPPPSSVASFAATTMAPESSDASLANTADNAIPPPISDPIAIDKINELSPMSDNELTVTQTVSNELSSPVKQDSEEVSVSKTPIEPETPVPEEDTSKVETVKVESAVVEESAINVEKEIESKEMSGNDMDIPAPSSEDLELPEEKNDISNGTEDLPSPPSPICDDIDVISEKIDVNLDNTQVTIAETSDIVINSNHISDTEKSTPSDNEIGSKYSEQNVKAKDSLGNLIETIECNGNIEDEKLTLQKESSEIIPPIDPKEIKNVECVRTATTPDDSMPPSLSEANESAPAAGVTSNDESESFPLPPSELCRSESEQSPAASPESPASPASPAPEPAADTPAHTPQDPLPVSDKLAELIPEVPDVPELKTEMLQETTSDVAVTN